VIEIPHSAIRHYTALGAWGTRPLATLLDERRRQHPDREALVDAPNRASFFGGDPRRLSWRQTWDEVHSLAATLLAQGLTQGDVLCMQLPNCNEAVVTYFACALLGVVITPVPVQYREHELLHILGLTRARAIMTWRRGAGPDEALARSIALAAAQQAEHGRETLVLAWHTQAHSHAAACAAAADHAALTPCCATPQQLQALERHLATHPVDANETFAICWTSGTEGMPKGVARSHNQWQVAPRAVVEAVELFEGARLLNPFPLTNPGSLSGMVLPWLLTGGTLVQHQPFTLEVFVSQLEREAIDYTCASPALLTTLLQNESLTRGIDFSRLRRIVAGGSALSEWLVEGYAQKFGVHIVNAYGSSEGAALYSSVRDVPDPRERAKYFPRLGSPNFKSTLTFAQWLETRLVEDGSGEVIDERGRPGELRVKGPNVFHGYYKAPELAAAAFDAEGFFRTGDLFEIAGDRRQFYKFVGRTKDIVIRGGVNISSAEVENLILEHPKVREVAVIGWPDARLGEKVCAVVVPQPGQTVDLAEITCWLRDEKRAAVHKLPEHLILSEGLPRNPTGKVLKRELRRLAPDAA